MPRAYRGVIISTAVKRRSAAIVAAALVAVAAVSDTAEAPALSPAAAYAAPPAQATVDQLAAERQLALTRPSRAAARPPARPATPRTPARPPVHKAHQQYTPLAAVRLPDAGRARTVLAFALAQLGDPYVWGAAGPNRWDCSGLAMKAFAQVGIHLPHNSYGMLGRGRRVTRAQLQPGDLVFPHGGHVQIYVGAGKVVEAAQSGVPVRVTRIWGFMTARRIL